MKSHSNAIDKSMLTRAALELFDEAYRGPANPRATWFVDNEPDCGFLGTLRELSAEQASRPLAPGKEASAASHAGHLSFALSLANRAARGEDAYTSAKWEESWSRKSVNGEEWVHLTAGLEREIIEFRHAIEEGRVFDDEELLAGALAVIAHGAWHLGALRQGLDKVRLAGQ